MDIARAAPPLLAGIGNTGQAVNPAHVAARETAQEFESMVLGLMLEPMFSGLKTDGPFGGGSSENIYRSMLIQEYAKSIGASGGVGIADSVYKEILKLQELHQ